MSSEYVLKLGRHRKVKVSCVAQIKLESDSTLAVTGLVYSTYLVNAKMEKESESRNSSQHSGTAVTQL